MDSNKIKFNQSFFPYKFICVSGSGCHHLHLHKGECQTDQYLEGCRVYRVLKNGVSFALSWLLYTNLDIYLELSAHYYEWDLWFHALFLLLPSRVSAGKKTMHRCWQDRTGKGKYLAWRAAVSLPTLPDGFVEARITHKYWFESPSDFNFPLLRLVRPVPPGWQFSGGPLLQTQVHWAQQLPDPGVGLCMGGLSSWGRNWGAKKKPRHTVGHNVMHNKITF